MKHHIIILLCFFLLGQVALTSKSVSVEITCKKVTKSMDSDDCYDFCVTAFNTVPESRTADLAGLVMIVTVLTKGNHTSISQKAKDLLNQSGWSHMMEQCLLTCVVVYESSVVDLEHAIDYVKERNYGEFASLMVAVNTMPVTCDDGFEELGEKNLLKDENDAAFELGEITQAIFQLLQN